MSVTEGYRSVLSATKTLSVTSRIMSTDAAAETVIEILKGGNSQFSLTNSDILWGTLTTLKHLLYGVVNFIWLTISTFILRPATILKRSVLKLSLLPLNAVLGVLLHTSVEELVSTTDINGVIAIIRLVFQYAITTAAVGSMLGLCLGIMIGFLHRTVRIPVLYISVMPKYMQVLTTTASYIRDLFSDLLDLSVRNIPVMTNGDSPDEDNLFADLLETYEHEYRRVGEAEKDFSNNDSPISIQGNDTHLSDLSALSNLFDSVPETGTVRTDLGDLRSTIDRKGKSYSSAYSDNFDIKELHHRK
ncbi:HCL273Cp [Eremothecium sinecaudum]|uniref:HCL273Cp n=1 Tax=Eremothecium sinecaudum TaxID=45286 RepID=A0A120K1Y8_9SACH|nr:HCL273Cp [Eremothecium sinecaudum]AMD19878.1 HCL273Cp [Eremothecium sinecaudum]